MSPTDVVVMEIKANGKTCKFFGERGYTSKSHRPAVSGGDSNIALVAGKSGWRLAFTPMWA
jgi:hypothetical protein